MIYKLKLIFSHPMALAQTPPLARLEMAAYHVALGLSFFLTPYKVIFACILALILLLVRQTKKSAFVAEHIFFLQQRTVLAIAGVMIFLVMYADGTAPAISWEVLSKIMTAICFYDAYLAYNGITGLFFLNPKKILNK